MALPLRLTAVLTSRVARLPLSDENRVYQRRRKSQEAGLQAER
jgi:hypothetical protein